MRYEVDKEETVNKDEDEYERVGVDEGTEEDSYYSEFVSEITGEN